MKIAIEFVNAFLDLIIAGLFFNVFWKRKASVLFSVIAFCVSTALLTFILLNLKGTPFFFILRLLSLFIIALIYENKILNKLLLSIIYFAITGVIEEGLCAALSAIFSVDYATILSGPLYITGMLLSKLIMVLVVVFLKARRNTHLIEQYKLKYLSVFIFPLSSLLLGITYHYIFVIIPTPSNATLILFLVSYSLLIAANLIVFDFIDSLYKNEINESHLSLASHIIENQTAQYGELIEHNKEIARILHDNKHFHMGLISELNEGKTDFVLKKLSDACSVKTDETVYTGDVIRTVVRVKSDEAAKLGITVEPYYRLDDKLLIDPIDVAIILGNALDNAIEACTKFESESKTVALSVILKDDTLYVQIRNPVIDNVDVEKLESDKDSSMHGFGILNIKTVAKKYDGEIYFLCQNNTFEVTMQLQNTAPEK